jgi:hypothetical protein
VNSPVFEETRPRDYLQRLAASGLGRAYKSLAASELGLNQGDVVLDLGCGRGADLPDFAMAVLTCGPDGQCSANSRCPRRGLQLDFRCRVVDQYIPGAPGSAHHQPSPAFSARSSSTAAASIPSISVPRPSVRSTALSQGPPVRDRQSGELVCGLDPYALPC